MSDLLAARSQMAMSLAFHIVFAVAGMAMPLLMVIAEAAWLRTGDKVYRELAKRWAKGTAILFATGAVSGTVLSFELGLLWPEFMRFAGPIIGMPFSLEGFAFFLEAIFLGIFLYGWDRVPPLVHWLSGVAVWVSGTMSGVFVVIANGWMNAPVGFEMVAGEVVSVDPWAAMTNSAAFSEALHMTIAAFCAVGMAVAGIHAFMLLREPTNVFHRKALAIALSVGATASLLMPLSGDVSAKYVASHQPEKLAAMEAHWDTTRQAPFVIGGWPDETLEQTRWGLEVPGLLSFLAHGDVDAEVIGLRDISPELRPPVLPVHLGFQVMIGCAVVLAVVSLLGAALAAWRRGLPDDRWYLRLLVASAPLGILAIQAGWVVTEVGRQPWVIRGVMKTSDAVTPMPGLIVPFTTFSLLYLFLAVVVVHLLHRQVFASPRIADQGDRR